MTPVDQNHYEFLGVEAEASPEEIARAVTKLREMWAPGSLALYSLVDREEHKALLDRLEEAALVLGDERARGAYDDRHGIGRQVSAPLSRSKPGPARQLLLEEIVEAVDVAPAWPGSSVEPAMPPPVEPVAVEPEAPAVSGELFEEAIDLDLDDLDEPLGEAGSPAGPRALAAALDRISVPVSKVAEPGPPLPELGPETEYTGDLLRRLREARGFTLRELADRTRITRGHLENVEAEAFTKLPERVYLRGILTAYARELKLDGARLAETYLARWAARRG